MWCFESHGKLCDFFFDPLVESFGIVVDLPDEVFSFFLNVAPFVVGVDESNIFFDVFEVEKTLKALSHALNA